MATLTLVRGDITGQRVDAIVNAANERLAGGGGVDGAIHHAGGPGIMAACDAIRAAQGGCATGSAVITTAGRLPAKAVIHTVGPVWRGGGHREPELLASCYRESLRLARDNGFRTIAFPSISTGVYGYPVGDAAAVAIGAIRGVLSADEGAFDEVRIVLFSQGDLEVYRDALRAAERAAAPQR